MAMGGRADGQWWFDDPVSANIVFWKKEEIRKRKDDLDDKIF